MLLQRIVAQFDAELERLRQLRAIVAGLHSAPIVLAALDAEPVPPIEARTESSDEHTSLDPVAALVSVPLQRERATRRVYGMPRQRVARRVTPERMPGPTALTSVIPAGPVIVSAKALAAEMETRSKSRCAVATLQTAPEDTKIESLTKDLADRWVAEMRRMHG